MAMMPEVGAPEGADLRTRVQGRPVLVTPQQVAGGSEVAERIVDRDSGVFGMNGMVVNSNIRLNPGGRGSGMKS